MTVKLIFKNEIPISFVDELLLPSGEGVGFTISEGSTGINRHDVLISTAGSVTYVEIDDITISELSQNTEESIINTVAAEHIKTVNE